ncbi:E3 ubiquitin/ISG15 ligase TRIM25-like [Astyanax mexicanus]|uniref:E3 ubiquitin/ISG15 ligase TRIM25-like n=1 Tax=Astyanax mexicanus TaxID=7994 RepID=UPI0020CAA490|nr:E3 ubiquitin/ISG15 ligase TRIM25-like [Astyanax mexicanus]
MASAGLPIYLDEFNCSLCLDLTTDPVTTPCGHNICKGCINVFWVDQNQRGIYSCPYCRRTFSQKPDLNTNLFLATILENLKMREVHQNTGTATVEVSADLKEFRCIVCLDLPTDPVTISCGHTLCMRCINRCWDQEDYRGVYSCPQCNQTFIPRPFLCKNSFIADMVENLKMTESFLF